MKILKQLVLSTVLAFSASTAIAEQTYTADWNVYNLSIGGQQVTHLRLALQFVGEFLSANGALSTPSGSSPATGTCLWSTSVFCNLQIDQTSYTVILSTNTFDGSITFKDAYGYETSGGIVTLFSIQ